MAPVLNGGHAIRAIRSMKLGAQSPGRKLDRVDGMIGKRIIPNRAPVPLVHAPPAEFPCSTRCMWIRITWFTWHRAIIPCIRVPRPKLLIIGGIACGCEQRRGSPRQFVCVHEGVSVVVKSLELGVLIRRNRGVQKIPSVLSGGQICGRCGGIIMLKGRR